MMSFNKKGIIGSVMITFVVTIAIILILLLFIFGSSMVKKFDKFLNWCGKNFNSVSMGEYINECR